MTSPQTIPFVNCRGETLVGVLYFAAAASNAAALLCHGMESDKSSAKLIFRAERLAVRGIHALRFDFSYVGESSDRFENLTDAQRWMRHWIGW